MDYQSWKKQTARRKAIWPCDMKGYMKRQCKITISLDSELAEWLMTDVVGRSSFTGDLEEAVITALRMMRGEIPLERYPSRSQAEINSSRVSRKAGS